MRLHELAKKHGFNQQDLLVAVQKQGFDVKDALADVEGGVEAWVAENAASGWTPPPPIKKTAVKKKKVLVKPVAAQPEAEGAPPAVTPTPAAPAATPAPATATPPVTATPSAPQATAEPVPALPAEGEGEGEPAPEAEAPAPAVTAQPEPEPAPEPISAPAPAAPAAKVKSAPPPPPAPDPAAPAVPPPPIKRIGSPVRGSAAVGQASAETIAAIKRAAAGRGEGAARPAARAGAAVDAPAGRTGRSTAARPTGRPGPRIEAVPPEADLSGKPVQKQRVKTKARPSDMDERDVAEKKAKASKRSRGVTEDWGLDDGDDVEFTETVDEAATAEGEAEPLAAELLAADAADAKSGAGFKHKRADFKSKRLQYELPASFAEIDNEFTRSIAAGGGRRRGGRSGGGRRSVGRRGRTRRFTQVIPRDPSQAAVVRLGMTLRDLSVALGVKLNDILSRLLAAGEMVQVNDILSEAQINSIAETFRIPLQWEDEDDLEEDLARETQRQEDEADADGAAERPPVITFMGHVDHGKTSLLDAIRNTRVAAGEHGGITQHIGAYSVMRDGKRVSFLDTPGHEAFSAMRARGANLTDIAVLVVAADDGVMPQTEEAAAHAKNAGVPIVVAINKCDLPAANPDRVRQELANRLGLLPEEWGGQVGMVEVSAHTKAGIDTLVERILLEAEVLELRANPDRPATGFVVEAKIAEGQGVVATLLVTDGTLRNGDVILCSNGYGKIRFMFDEFGTPIESALPGTPVRVSGLSAVPEAGDKFFILSDLLKARAIAEQRERESRAAAMAQRQHVTLENLTSHLAGSGTRELSVIVKADVVGSLEVLDKTLREMATDEVAINVIHAAVGGVNHADVILADASDAIILGFHVGVDSTARTAAAGLGVQIRTYHVIYRILEDMRAALEGLLPPEEKEVVQGHIEIRQVFRSSKLGAIAGCYVADGAVQRTNRIRLYRNQVVVYEGAIQSLKRLKDDVREVRSGFECGVKIANYDAIEAGDVIEAYSIEEVARKL